MQVSFGADVKTDSGTDEAVICLSSALVIALVDRMSFWSRDLNNDVIKQMPML